MENRPISRKNVEAFVPWKEQTASQGRRGSLSSTSKSGVKGMKKQNETPSRAMGATFNHVSRSLYGRLVERSAGSPRGEVGRERRIPGFRGSGECSDVEVASGANEEEYPLRSLSTNSCQRMEAGNHSTGSPYARRLTNANANANSDEGDMLRRAPISGDDGKKHSSSHVMRQSRRNGSRRSPSPARQELQLNGLGRHDDSGKDDTADEEEEVEEPERHAIVLRHGHAIDKVVVDSEEEIAESDDMQDADNAGDMQALAVENESRSRKERRQLQSKRDREGDRRRKEGRPANFLLVDEHTRKPYGVGLGAWRKELMLLSRELDPAVGNINHHPEGAVSEIANWIQHTWEYEFPVRFEHVKHVIARGVTLRRSEIWRRMRNNEPKPEGMSDRSWRSLERQMKSPATLKKSEDCSKANASRMNFGRTGPSGEVGVRERLRRALRRSPDPEEIQKEMARDKGYGGRSRSKNNCKNIMHGSRPSTNEILQVQGGDGSSGKSVDSTEEEDEVNGHMHAEGEDVSLPIRRDRNSGDRAVQQQLLAMTDDQIAQHPLVMKMMQRLEALEYRPIAAAVDTEEADTGKGGESVFPCNEDGGGVEITCRSKRTRQH